MTQRGPETPAVGSQVDRGVGRLVEKLRDAAPQAGHYGAWSGGVLLEQAADEIDRLAVALKKALEPERDDFLQGICVALQCVTASDDGVLWREIVETAGAESLLRYATFVEPDEWGLAGFRRYAKVELHRTRPRKCVPPLKTPEGDGPK